MQEYCIKTSSNICFGYLLESLYVLWGNGNKTMSFFHNNLSIKESLQQQIHFNGNIFGNKRCRCNGADPGWFLRGVRFDQTTVLTLSIWTDRYEQTDPHQTPPNTAFDQGLHCFSHIKQFYTHSQVVKWTCWREVQIKGKGFDYLG